MKSKTITVWCAINKDGNLSMHLKEPSKNKTSWVSDAPFCNSIVYNKISTLFEKTSYNWTNDPQAFVINI